MNLHRSTYHLVEQAPDDSARHVLSTAQYAVAIGGIVGCAVALLLNWSLTLIALAAGATLLHLATSIYKLYVLTRGWSAPRPGNAASSARMLYDERALPVYTVLVPRLRSLRAAARARQHLLLAHGLAVQAFRALRPRNGQIGITLNLTPTYPVADTAPDHRTSPTTPSVSGTSAVSISARSRDICGCNRV